MVTHLLINIAKVKINKLKFETENFLTLKIVLFTYQFKFQS